MSQFIVFPCLASNPINQCNFLYSFMQLVSIFKDCVTKTARFVAEKEAKFWDTSLTLSLKTWMMSTLTLINETLNFNTNLIEGFLLSTFVLSYELSWVKLEFLVFFMLSCTWCSLEWTQNKHDLLEIQWLIYYSAIAKLFLLAQHEWNLAPQNANTMLYYDQRFLAHCMPSTVLSVYCTECIQHNTTSKVAHPKLI